jgi:hypothetical protein
MSEINYLFDEFSNEYEVEIQSITHVISEEQISRIAMKALVEGYSMKRIPYKKDGLCYDRVVLYNLKSFGAAKEPNTCFKSTGPNMFFGSTITKEPTINGGFGVNSVGRGMSFRPTNAKEPTKSTGNDMSFGSTITKEPTINGGFGVNFMGRGMSFGSTNAKEPTKSTGNDMSFGITNNDGIVPNILDKVPETLNKAVSIKPGSYVLYNRKNSIAKVLEYDTVSNSYTIECEGRIINTTDKFLVNIDSTLKEMMEKNV